MNTRFYVWSGLLVATLVTTTVASRSVLIAEDRNDDKPVQSSDTRSANDENKGPEAENREAIREGLETLIRKGAEAYCQAFCDHDARSAAMQFTENAEFVTTDGQTLSGRKEIQSALEASFAQGHDWRLELAIDSIRFPAPNVAIEDGTSFTILGEEERPVSYTAVHVKEGDEWKIASIRERAVPSGRPHREKLRELDWLLGDWIDESSDSSVLFSCRPVDNGNFLTRDFVVRIGDEPAMTGTQRIGWDPIARHFRMWYFDSEGGYGDGSLSQRDDGQWLLKLSGVTADGEPASGTFLYRQVSKNQIAWRILDQMIGTTHHDVDEDEEITLVRQSPAPRAISSANGETKESRSGPAKDAEGTPPAKKAPANEKSEPAKGEKEN